MTLSPRNRRVLLTLIVGVLASILVGIFVSRFFLARIPDLEKAEKDAGKKIRLARPKGGLAIHKAIERHYNDRRKLEEILDKLKKDLEFPFPNWIAPPEEANPGEYFRRMHSRIRDDLRSTCMVAGVALLDGNLGFRGDGVIDKKQAVEDLKKLSIVEKLVSLLATSKVAVVVRVEPLDPVATGAYKEEPNPEYRPATAIPKTIKRPYPPFIKEYPVTIEIITYIDPLMDFLNNIRQEKQFLLVRDIAVRSQLKTRASDLAERFKPGMVHVAISAAGMRFLGGEELDDLRAKTRASELRERLKTEPLPTGVSAKGY